MDTTRTMPLLGATITLTLYDTDPRVAEGIFKQAYQEGLRLQSIFNLYDQKSELSRLNEKRSAIMSEEFLTVLKVALDYGAQTQGAYDVSRGKQYLARKYKQQLPAIQCSYKDIHISGNHVKLTHPDVSIDLNSIAKGFIGDRLVEFLISLGVASGFVDVRGDLRIFGNHLEVVDIKHPRTSGAIATLILEKNAVATSGDYLQYDTAFERSHILGARNASATIVAPTLMEADALATCAMVLSPEQFKELTAHPSLLISTAGTCTRLHNFEALEYGN